MENLPCLVFLCLFALAVPLFSTSIRARRRRIHEEILREVAARSEQSAEEDALREALARWLSIRECFPFLRSPKLGEISASAIEAAIELTLLEARSLGTFGVPPEPAPALPPRERRRHLYIVGKTGSGKTTFLEHLIEEDLAAGRGVGVVGPEGEFFRARLLPLTPAERRHEVIYFAPADPRSPLSLNPLAVEPGEDRARSAEDLFTIFRRSLSDDELGPRMQPILQNGFAALVGRPGATLFDLKRLLEDPGFRYDVASTTSDEYVRAFWLETYARYPKGADLPITNRLDQFLRPLPVRRALCQPASSFSIREVLAEGRILFLDLYGLSEETRLLFGQLLLSKFQLELMRRELAGSTPPPFHLYCDEFQAVAGYSEGVWRELLSRGRKYGLSLTLANQYPSQLPTGLQNEILGNVNSLVAFALGNKDAQVVRKELLEKSVRRGEIRLAPIAAEELIELPVGTAYAKLAGGRAFQLRIPPPLRVASSRATEEIIRASWERYGRRAEALEADESPAPPMVQEPESFLE